MNNDRRKVVLIGTGMVGMSFAYALVNQGGICNELVLVDVILLIATGHKAAKIALPILIALLVLSVVLGTQLSFIGSLLDLFLMLVPAALGAGLILRAAFIKKDADGTGAAV